ncbi:hypothetical protein BJV78DRAFT_1154831 [Lactifluus subvellereus]|nr:hypothetical protein BJV78DRAFT_1154831 [Lactifluus subvellereus]
MVRTPPETALSLFGLGVGTVRTDTLCQCRRVGFAKCFQISPPTTLLEPRVPVIAHLGINEEARFVMAFYIVFHLLFAESGLLRFIRWFYPYMLLGELAPQSRSTDEGDNDGGGTSLIWGTDHGISGTLRLLPSFPQDNHHWGSFTQASYPLDEQCQQHFQVHLTVVGTLSSALSSPTGQDRNNCVHTEYDTRLFESYKSSQSRAASRSSVDSVTESDEFMSLPGTPTADGEATFWEGESVHGYRITLVAYSCTGCQILNLSPGPVDGRESLQRVVRIEDSSSDLVLAPPQTSSVGKGDQVRTQQSSLPPDDPSCPVKGMFRLLDLITEQGSSGLVDKIVIAQGPLQAFINTLSPGAYSSITKVNFRILDNLLLKPIGYTGRKRRSARKLLMPQNSYTAMGGPILRSGLYVVRSFMSPADEQAYVLYWPEDTTWNDQAVSTVQRNRVPHQAVRSARLSSLAGHSKAIVWDDDDGKDDVSTQSENDESDRLYYFEVAKTTIKRRMSPPDRDSRIDFDPRALSPRLLHGETMQGFMTAKFRPAKTLVEPFTSHHQSVSQVRFLVGEDVVWCLSETLDDGSLETLMRLGLSTRFPKEYDSWKRQRNEIMQRFRRALAQRQGELHVILEQGSKDIQAKLQEAVVSEVLKVFPSLRREGFLPTSSPAAESADLEVDAGEVTGFRMRMRCGEPPVTMHRKSRLTLPLRFQPNVVSDCLVDAAVEAEGIAYACLAKEIESLVSGIHQQIFSIQKEECNKQAQERSRARRTRSWRFSGLVSSVKSRIIQRTLQILRNKEGALLPPGSLSYSAYEEHVSFPRPESYFVSGRQESLQNQEIEYHVHRLSLLADQRYAHLIEGDRILVGLVDSQGNVMILLERPSRIDNCLIAFDESKRMLAVYASARMQLHIFVFDEEFKSLRGLGTAIDLRPFYNPGVSIVHACFVHGSEEILFVDSSAQARIFSLITLQPKPHLYNFRSARRQKTLVFVTDDDQRPFSSHFSDIINNFEKASRKPTGDELRGISVSAQTFPSFVHQFLSGPDWPVSRFRAGEWLADLLCLIPIHIAITHENRFVPLKDGVLSAQLEKSLLGAEVNRIVDSLSLGWYESIFQSYWASKPVKVVSSMGEQSVGKSFALNHLVDTSFAGSAMRTTVALDFEGVHSLERSAQEDTLLVLFNTAISNLVLFRNNFALSRDITGLFQSFQSSSSVLDPASNPSLFQSTLVVIIKDVIDSDKAEITREFSLKFQKIVQDEQDANFITRLHGGKLQIIPWPVIESKEFYKLFPSLKRRLDLQPTSHHTAGEFLHTLKTLMAKLKANDWGAMSQTMAAHRANSLLAILPNALETGFSEIVPEPEPLKNFDTDLVIEAEDTEAQFLLTGPDAPVADRELRLATLRESWDRIHSRQHVDDSEWASGLVQHLTHLVDLRAAHVDKWLKSNIQRFQASHASLEELRRTFDSAVIDLRASVQLYAAWTPICAESVARSRESKAVWATPVHMCGQPCDLVGLQLPNGKSFTCSGTCRIPIQEHSCSALCSAPGICQIDTTPQSIEATFTGRHETFNTPSIRKLRSASAASRQLSLGRSGTQVLTFIAMKSSPSTSVRAGHPQQEHETRHGSMSRTRWAIDGPDGTSLELEGRKFSSSDDGAPMLCNLHIDEIMVPNPDQPKDWITHGLHWRRMGFKGNGDNESVLFVFNGGVSVDPYSREDQANFAKCDAMCPGPEHTVEVGGANAQPSRCTLALFHPPMDAANAPAGLGYVSNDGHHFSCKNPIVMQQAFHVIFVIDRSGSMCQQDRQPRPNAAGIDRITPTANDRLGAVFSALYSFWLARQAAIGRNAQIGGARRDSYSLIFFNHEPSTSIEGDFASSPDELLTAALRYEADGGTDFTRALEKTHNIMNAHWSTERTPVVIFLSDGEDHIRDEPVYDICRSAVRQGFVDYLFLLMAAHDRDVRRPLSFHAVSFGHDATSTSLRKMAQIALETQNNAPQDPLLPATANIPSCYTEALDTILCRNGFMSWTADTRSRDSVKEIFPRRNRREVYHKGSGLQLPSNELPRFYIAATSIRSAAEPFIASTLLAQAVAGWLAESRKKNKGLSQQPLDNR